MRDSIKEMLKRMAGVHLTEPAKPRKKQNGGVKSGAAALKRAAQKRRNIRKHSKK